MIIAIQKNKNIDYVSGSLCLNRYCESTKMVIIIKVHNIHNGQNFLMMVASIQIIYALNATPLHESRTTRLSAVRFFFL